MDNAKNMNQFKMAQLYHQNQEKSKTAKRQETVVNEAQFRDQMIRGQDNHDKIPGLSKELATGYINQVQFDHMSDVLSLMQSMKGFEKRYGINLDDTLDMFDGKIRTTIQLSKSVDATGLVEANTTRNVRNVRETLDGMEQDPGFLEKLKALASGSSSNVMPENKRMMGSPKGGEKFM